MHSPSLRVNLPSAVVSSTEVGFAVEISEAVMEALGASTARPLILKTSAQAAVDLPHFEDVTLYPAVPLTIQRVANVERAQLLVEAASRGALQRFLSAWQPVLLASRSLPEARGLVRFAVDVDPLVI